MRIIDIESINQAMNNETQFVQRCEEVFHDKVASAASTILAGGRERRIVALTGPSGSGKTTTAMRLRDYLENLGVLFPATIFCDCPFDVVPVVCYNITYYS